MTVGPLARFCGHPGGLIQLGTCDGGEWKAATILEHEYRQEGWCTDFGEKFCAYHMSILCLCTITICTLYYILPHACVYV